MSWPLRPISELCELAVDCVNKTAPVVEHETPYKMIRTTNVKGGFVDIHDVRYVSKDTFDKWTRRSRPRYGDVILTREAPVGEVGRCTFSDEENIFLGQRLFQYRPDPEKLDWNFLAYVLQSPEVQGRLHGRSFGATVPHVKVGDAESLLIPCPPLEEQRQIGCVLSAYDDLIAINQRRIVLLEDAARRLYREWFVHLRFPSHESVPVKDGVPEGWCKKPMTSIADFVNGFAFKPEHLGEAGLPVVKIPELRSGITSKTPYNPGNIVPQRNHIITGDILFSWSATLLVNEWGEGPALLNQHLFKVIPHNELHKRLVRFAVEAAIPELTGHAVGATMQHIRRSALDNHLMLVPDETTAEAFAAQADPMMDAVLNLTAQIRELTKARDLLLPKLMSGQLDVSGIRLPDEVAA